MTAGVSSLRQFARLIGVSETAIRKAVAAGVFRESLWRDPQSGVPGISDLGLAVREWEKSGRQLRGSGARVRERESESSAPSELPASVQPPTSNLPAAADDEPADDVVEPVSQSLVDAQRMAVLERARKLKLENDLREGQLVEAAVAARQAFDFSRTVRENVLNIPSRLSAELAAEGDAGRVFMRLDSALREALNSTAAALETDATHEERANQL